MINKVKDNFSTGLTRLKWIATFVAERTKAETSVARLMYEISKLEGRMEEIYRDIGRRVSELKAKDEKDVFSDFLIQQSLSELKDVRETMDDYRKQAKKINDLSE
jgi:hypothetical protein